MKRFLPAAACLLLFFALGLRTITAKAPTNDEPAHLLRGAILGQGGDLRYQTGHAPFSHRLMSLLINSQEGFPAVDQLDSWAEGERLQIAAELMWGSGLQVEQFLFLGRIPILMLGVLLGAMVANWAYSWLGRIPMLISILIYCCSPNIIAGSSLATTDLAVAAMYFATIYFWWRYWRTRKAVWWWATAVFLGFALATKLTAVLLLPVLFLLTILFVWRGRLYWQPLLRWFGLIPISLLSLWLVYGFEIASFAGLPFEVPAASYLVSWQMVMGHVERGHQAFLLGELSGDGWWYYFPLTFLIKTPLLPILLLLTALVVVISRQKLWRTPVFLLLPVLALFAAAMTSGLNIGYRHILPVLPFLFVFLAASWLFLRRWLVTKVFLVLGLVWLVFIAIRQQPDYLAYFNELVGGTDQGYQYLGDSNLDWGQDINILAEEIDTRPGPWFVSYAGVGDPDYYGIPADTLIDLEDEDNQLHIANPQPGFYAISANNLQGNIPDADYFDWFRRQEPEKTLGGSILIFDVPPALVGQWAAFCLDPGPLLSTEEMEKMVGDKDLRPIFFDCQQSWVMPNTKMPGWFVLPQSEDYWFTEVLHAEVKEGLQHVYRHRASADLPSFDIYYWPGKAVPEILADPQVTAEIDGSPLSLPYAANEYSRLNSYQSDASQWISSWTVLSAADQPFSMQAHFHQEGAAAPMVGDSLGYSSDQWREGDIFIQRFVVPEGGTAQILETGLYNFQTLDLVGERIRLKEP